MRRGVWNASRRAFDAIASAFRPASSAGSPTVAWKATNNQTRLLTRLAHGFHSAAALIAVVFLKLGGLAIDLGRRPSLG